MITIGITGAGGGVGSAVLRSLALSKLETRVVCFDMAADAPSLYRGDRARLLPKASAPHFCDAVLTACEAEGIQALIPGLDPHLEPLSQITAQLRAIGCVLIASTPKINQLLFEKQRTASFFEDLNLPFVKTRHLQDAEELLDLYGFPLLVKPLSGSGSRGVRVLFNRSELRETASDGLKYVVQPYLIPAQWGIKKQHLRLEDIYNNYSLVQKDETIAQVLLDWTGVVFGSLLSTNNLKDGAVSRMEPVEQDPFGVMAKALEMAQALAAFGLAGPCNFQGRATEEGPFFYEINPRFSGGTGLRAALGFNEVEACLRRLVLNEDAEAVQPCLATRFDRIAGIHPYEQIMEAPLIAQLRREGLLELPRSANEAFTDGRNRHSRESDPEPTA